MRTLTAGVVATAVVALAGCGSANDYANKSRPAAPVNVTASISDQRIALSPMRLKAGPVVLIVTNQSSRSEELTLTGASGETACTAQNASSGPINPQGTASVQVVLTDGICDVAVAGGKVPPARLEVYGQRPSAQNQVGLP